MKEKQVEVTHPEQALLDAVRAYFEAGQTSRVTEIDQEVKKLNAERATYTTKQNQLLAAISESAAPVGAARAAPGQTTFVVQTDKGTMAWINGSGPHVLPVGTIIGATR